MYAALKYCVEDWTASGRVALVGDLPGVGPLVATWRPGEPAPAWRPHPFPPGTFEGGLGEVYLW